MYIANNRQWSRHHGSGQRTLFTLRNFCVFIVMLLLLLFCCSWAWNEYIHHTLTTHGSSKTAQKSSRAATTANTVIDGDQPVGEASCAALMERGFEYLFEQMNSNMANILAHVQQNGDTDARTRDGLHTVERALIRLAEVADSTALVQGKSGAVLEERLCFDLRDCPVPDCRCAPCISDGSSGIQRARSVTCPVCPTSLVKLSRNVVDGEPEERIVALPSIGMLENPTGTFYVITGAESSGNRYVVSMLVAAGCVGISGHIQPWDKPGSSFSTIDSARLVREAPHCAVVHRSFPHNGQWPNLRNMLFQIHEANYTPRVLYVTRNQHAVVFSQIRANHVRSISAAEDRIQKGKRQIFGFIASTNVWFMEIVYERLDNSDYISYVYNQIGYRGLNDNIPPQHPAFRNANGKYENKK